MFVSENMKQDIIDLIKKKGKARFWYDMVLEPKIKNFKVKEIICSHFSSLPIGSVDTLFQIKDGKLKDLARILRLGYYDFTSVENLDNEIMLSFDKKRKEAEKFRHYKEFFGQVPENHNEKEKVK